MGVFSQLKLLSWKNFVSKKRNKVRLAIEVLMPVTLFLVLMFLRRIGDKKILPDCYFKPKAMPSAGNLAFFQSFYCSLNNTCDNSITNASLSAYDESVISKIMRAIEIAFELDPDETNTGNTNNPAFPPNLITAQLSKYLTDLRDAVASDKELSETDLGTLFTSLTLSNDTKQYTCGVSLQPPEGRSLEKREVPREVEEAEDPGGTQTPPHVGETSNSSAMPQIPLSNIAELPILKRLDNVFCGPNVPSFARQLESLSGQTESTWERKKEELETQSVSTKPKRIEFEECKYENDTTDFCNDLICNIDQSLETRFIWRIFKPFIRGKIVYTPDAPVIKRLMMRIHDSFKKPQSVIEELVEAMQVVPGLEELHMLRSKEDVLKKIVKSDLGRDILQFFQVKSDGDPSDPKTEATDLNSIKKLIDRGIEMYKMMSNGVHPVLNMTDVLKYSECIDWERTVPVSDAKEAVHVALDLMKSERLWALVEFTNISANATQLPPAVTYKIRTGIERTHATFQLRDRVYRPRVRRDPFIDLKHITGGWAYIQNLVDGEIIREQTGRKRVPGIYLQQTPYPCHIKDMFRESITKTFPMFMIVSWIFLFSMLVKKIVWEKEKRVTQTIRIMGVGKVSHWLAWFLDAFIPMFVVSILLAFILVFGKIVPFSSFIVVWLFLLAFIFPTIALAFLVSTCFNKSSVAAAVSGLLFLLIYLPYPPISQFEERIDPDFKISLCLISNIAFGLGCTWLANMEELGWGGHMDNINTTPVPGNPIRMTLIIGMLLLDAFIYFIIALYIENVFPGDDGIGRPFYYLFTKSYWCGTPSDGLSIDCESKNTDLNNSFEAEPEDGIVGVSVRNITKKFGRKLALNDLNVNFYEDQVTSFLGHNGAGKSTAISIMTGLIAPTYGTVRLYGKELKADADNGRQDLGICSQENVLFDDLTVEEHLYFFARLKTNDEVCAVENAYNLMKDVGILNKRYTQTKHLSGGTQRKLCVATAFIGGSKVVFLDEPTAGVDPASRRAIWDLLIKYKKGRTVILTTHFMDEADLLGDRIAIIAKGSIVCCGSPVFLKTELGSGYYLTIDCDIVSDAVGRNLRPSSDKTEESTVALNLTNVLQAVLPEVQFLEQIGSELTFVIPSKTNVHVYDEIFAALERDKVKLHVQSYGVSDTSLEEIFLKIAETAESNDTEKDDDNFDICSCFRAKSSQGYDSVADIDRSNVNVEVNDEIDEIPKLSSIQYIFSQFSALLIKRAHHHSRNYTTMIVEIVLPTVFIALALYLASILPSVQKMPPQAVDINAYAPSHIFYSLDIPDDPLLRSYEAALLSQYGMGTKCINQPGSCGTKKIPLGSISKWLNESIDTTPCNCNGGRYSCEIEPPSPPWTLMSSGDRLYNLTGQNITNWIVKTELADSYIRYGGISMGYKRVFNSLGLLDLVQLFQLKQVIPLLGAMASRADNPPETLSLDRLVTALMLTCSKSVGSQLLKGVDVNDNIIIWYNNRGWISGIAFMNAVSNMVLRASLPANKDPSAYSISLINHPLPISSRQFEDEIDKQSNVSLLRALAVIWALAFIPATYAVYIISERYTGLKQLQMISGVRRWIYWSSGLIWDFSCFAFTIIIILIIFVIYNETAYIQAESIVAFILLLLTYGFVSITFVYPLSFLFDVPSSGFVAISTANIFIGMFTLLTTFVLGLITEEDNPFYLNTIFLIFPQFCLGRALLNMSIVFIRTKTLANFGVKDFPDYLEWDVTSKFIVLMLVMGCIFFIVTLLIEYRGYFRNEIKNDVPLSYADGEDEDVANERDRVLNNTAKAEGDILLLDKLTKSYKTEGSPAVDGLCLGVKPGECFGLLGLNGAGKTTVFKMLTGNLKPSSGDASIFGESILRDSADLPMGYCPQSNALDSYLTPSEHLAFFGRLRGLKGRALNRMVSKNIMKLGLEAHRNKISSALSGGNKRKLNTAISLVGDPRVILLDEPTSGMDPRARRFLWRCVQSCVREGRCVVLTSHSMEECQSLCSRLGILVNGRFRCLGSCQHLKSKFDEGYSVTVRSSSVQSVDEVQAFSERNLPIAGQVTVNYLQVKMCLKPGAVLGHVFLTLDQMKNQGLIRDYSINQTTLEQIFIKLTETQNQPLSAKLQGSKIIAKYLKCCCRENEDSIGTSPALSVPTEVLVQPLSDDDIVEVLDDNITSDLQVNGPQRLRVVIRDGDEHLITRVSS